MDLNQTTRSLRSLITCFASYPFSSLCSERGSGQVQQGKNKKHRCCGAFVFELVGQNCNSVKSRILCLRFINIEIIPLNTVLVNRFLKSFYKIIETMSYYFLYLMYKYRLKRGKPILSLSFYATSIFRNSSSA